MTTKELEKILKAVANHRRLSILKYLQRTKKANVGDIADHLKLSFRSTSRHLAILKAVDLIDKEQKGVEMVYNLEQSLPSVIKNIIDTL